MRKSLQVERMRELGTLFLHIAESETETRKNHLDMGEPTMVDEEQAYPEDVCGTVACHGGWADWLLPSVIKKTYLDYSCDVDFEVGHDKISHFIGMENLTRFMSSFHEIWGNRHGCRMFESSEAFYSMHQTKHRKVTLKDVGIHWLKVADRYEASGVNYNVWNLSYEKRMALISAS